MTETDARREIEKYRETDANGVEFGYSIIECKFEEDGTFVFSCKPVGRTDDNYREEIWLGVYGKGEVFAIPM